MFRLASVTALSRSVIVTLALSAAVVGCGQAATSPSAAVSATPAPVASPSAASTPPSSPSSAPSAASPAASPGASLSLTGRIENTTEGFAITLPDAWVRLGLEPGEIDEVFKQGFDLNPEFSDTLKSQISAMSPTIKLFALDQDGILDDGAFFGNANLIKLSGLGFTLDTLETLNENQLKGLSFVKSHIETDRVDLSAGEAIRFRYDAEFGTASGGTADVKLEQYILLAGGSQWILSVTGGPVTTADAMELAESFEVLD